MKKISLLFVALVAALMAFAVPAKRGVTTITQPDGTTLNVCMHGDEHFHYYTTEDGYLLKANEQGVFEYAEVQANDIHTLGVKAHSQSERTMDERNVLKRLSPNAISKEMFVNKVTQSRLQRMVRPRSVGTKDLKEHGVIILVNFSDVTFKTSNPQTVFYNAMMQKGYSTNGATGSARDYFIATSDSAYQPDFEVWGPYTVSKTSAYYAGSDGTANAEYMIQEACSLAYADGKSFAKYDSDGDKVVDYVYVIYAGYSSAEGAEDAVWPHSWNLSESDISKSNRTFGGYTIDLYACGSELTGTSGSTIDGIGTFCHEFSHVLGLPDLYDTNYGTNKNKTLGEWDIMDYGSYNNDGKTPPLYSAYEKYFMGWVTPKLMNEAENVTLHSMESSQDARIVTSNGTLENGVNTTDWVYYFENRQQTGWDAYLPGHGLLVTKVKYDATIWSSNKPNNGSTMYIDVVEADGKVSSYGDAGDTYPGTSKVTSYTPFSTYPLTNITETDGVITFKFMGGISKCTVTFNAGSHGTCATSSLTETAASSGVTLPAVTPESGWTFLGWATDGSLLDADAGLAGATYYPQNNLTLYAIYQDASKVRLSYSLEGVVKVAGPDGNYADINADFVAKFVADECYLTASSENTLYEVKVGDVAVDCVSFEDDTLLVSLTAAQVTDKVDISIYNTSKIIVSVDVDNATTTGGVDCLERGDDYLVTITPNADYLITEDDIMITMGGADLTYGTDFTYEDNVLTIYNVTGDLDVVIIASRDPSTISCFEESFDNCIADISNDVSSSLNSYCDNSGWTGTKVFCNSGSLKLGSGSSTGKITSPALGLVGTVTVSASLSGKSSGTLNLSVSGGGTLSASTYSVTTSASTMSVTIKECTTATKFTIASTTDMKVFYLDDFTACIGTEPYTQVQNVVSGSQVMVINQNDGLLLCNLPNQSNVKIFDVAGRMLINEDAVSNEQKYQLGKGIYLIRVSSPTETTNLKAIK